MKEHENSYWKVTTPAGKTYSKHKSLSDSLKHVGESLQHRGIAPTVKEAMSHGFNISKDR